MRSFKRVCLFLLMFIPFSITAGIRPCPGELGFQVEYLFFNPLLDDTYYAIISGNQETAVPDGERFNNQLRYQSGYRLEGLYTFCNCLNDVRLRYTSLHSDHSDGVSSSFFTGTFLFPTKGASSEGIGVVQTGTASSHIHFHYYAVDLLFSQLVYDHAPFHLFFQVGAQFADFKIKEELHYTAFIPEVEPAPQQTEIAEDPTTISHFWGIGPEVALDFNYWFGNCVPWLRCIPGTFGLGGNARAFLLVGESRVEWNYVNTDFDTTFQLHDSKIWRIVPAVDIRFGLNYFHCLPCGPQVNLEIGYEVLCHVRAVSGLRFENPDFRGYSFNNYTNVDMHGLFLAFGIAF